MVVPPLPLPDAGLSHYICAIDLNPELMNPIMKHHPITENPIIVETQCLAFPLFGRNLYLIFAHNIEFN